MRVLGETELVKQIGVLAAAALCAAAAACTSTGSPHPPTSKGRRVTAVSLQARLAPTPVGFVSELKDSFNGEHTGYLGAHRVLPLACDSGSLGQSHVLGGELRFYDDNSSYPGTVVVLCLAELSPARLAAATAAGVVRDRETLGAPTTFPFRTFPVPGVPGATGIGLDGNENVYFAAGPYYICIAALDESTPNSSTAQVLARDLAVAEYHQLRS